VVLEPWTLPNNTYLAYSVRGSHLFHPFSTGARASSCPGITRPRQAVGLWGVRHVLRDAATRSPRVLHPRVKLLLSDPPVDSTPAREKVTSPSSNQLRVGGPVKLGQLATGPLEIRKSATAGVTRVGSQGRALIVEHTCGGYRRENSEDRTLSYREVLSKASQPSRENRCHRLAEVR